MKRVLAFMLLGAVFCMTAAGCGKTENISDAKTETEAAGTAGAESAGGGTEEVESQAAADSEPLAEFDVSFANEPFEKPDTADFYKENEWGVQTLLFFTNGQDALPLAAAALKEAGVDILMDESGEYPQKGTQNFIQSSSTNAQGELAACSGDMFFRLREEGDVVNGVECHVSFEYDSGLSSKPVGFTLDMAGGYHSIEELTAMSEKVLLALGASNPELIHNTLYMKEEEQEIWIENDYDKGYDDNYKYTCAAYRYGDYGNRVLYQIYLTANDKEENDPDVLKPIPWEFWQEMGDAEMSDTIFKGISRNKLDPIVAGERTESYDWDTEGNYTYHFTLSNDEYALRYDFEEDRGEATARLAIQPHDPEKRREVFQKNASKFEYLNQYKDSMFKESEDYDEKIMIDGIEYWLTVDDKELNLSYY